jgi:hypothetical protein
MSRFRSRLLVPALALVAFGFLVPALARALPVGNATLSVAERHEARQETAPDHLSQLWSLLSALWAENGSILDPNGGTSSGTGTEPGTGSSSDNGSGLEPNG